MFYFDVKYISYFQKEKNRHYMNGATARIRFFKESEYMSMRFNPGYASSQERFIAKTFRRRVGVLKR